MLLTSKAGQIYINVEKDSVSDIVIQNDGKGDVNVSSMRGDLNLYASGTMNLTSEERMNLNAPQIHLNSDPESSLMMEGGGGPGGTDWEDRITSNIGYDSVSDHLNFSPDEGDPLTKTTREGAGVYKFQMRLPYEYLEWTRVHALAPDPYTGEVAEDCFYKFSWRQCRGVFTQFFFAESGEDAAGQAQKILTDWIHEGEGSRAGTSTADENENSGK